MFSFCLFYGELYIFSVFNGFTTPASKPLKTEKIKIDCKNKNIKMKYKTQLLFSNTNF